MSRTHFGYPLALGDVQAANVNSGLPGLECLPPVIYEITPVALDADGIAAAQAVAGAGNLTLNGALASGGTVTLDVPRTVEIDSSDAGDTTQTATVTGTDVYGKPMTELIAFNGTTAVAGQKAFKKITQIAISAAMTGNANAGTTDVFGLPVRVTSRNRMLTAWDGAFVTTGTFAGGDTTSPATTTTNDVRGTFLVPSAADGTRVLTCYIWPTNPDNLIACYGVTQV